MPKALRTNNAAASRNFKKDFQRKENEPAVKESESPKKGPIYGINASVRTINSFEFSMNATPQAKPEIIAKI